MQQSFICPTHRSWLNQNPDAAVTHFSTTQDTAQYYRDMGDWQEALPYLGCAFETAEIVMGQHRLDPLIKVINFTSSAILLADTYQKLAQTQQGLTVYKQAQQRLVSEYSLSLHDIEKSSCIKQCIKSLFEGSNHLFLTLQARSDVNINGQVH